MKMAFAEKTFSVTNTSGQTLHGIIHHPPNPNGGMVIMFNIGLHYRVCHSRLFIRQARDLQNNGFIVVRFDTTGIGYSQGEMPCGRAIDTFDTIQMGYFRDDALLVLNYCSQQLQPRKIFFLGLCGGALTATIAASQNESVNGVVFIAGPVTVTSPEIHDSTLHPFEADVFLKGYIYKLLSFKSWGRFILGKTSYKDIIKSIRVKLADKMTVRNSHLSPNDSASASTEIKGDYFNNVFFRAFQSLMKSGQDIFFVMPELDRATYDFNKFFIPLLKEHPEYEKQSVICQISKADHTFSRPESSQMLFDIIRDWLIKKL